MGFIIPQGEQSLVKSIGMTERMNLFRKQALRPYKTALTILGIVLILAVGGLVAYNVIQDKQPGKEMVKANERIDAQGKTIEGQQAEIATANENLAAANTEIEGLKEQDEANKAKLADLTAKADEAEQARERAQQQLDSLKNTTSATQAELERANERVRRAQNAAYAANRAANEARAAAAATAEKRAEKENEESDEATESTSKPSRQAASKPEQEQASANEVKPFAELSECNQAVYYIKMNDIVIYDAQKVERARFNVENKIGGTGFLMEDGRFVTARRVIEPWFYETYKGGVIGKDAKGNVWHYEDLQFCVNNNCEVVANCTAYSPSGVSFQLKNTDLRMYPESCLYRLYSERICEKNCR